MTETASSEEIAHKQQEYMSAESAAAAIAALQDESSKRDKKVQAAFMKEPRSSEDQDRIAQIDTMPDTWRSRIPIFRELEYWQRRADTFPYIRRSDELDNFFLRGISVHPRLSDYPQCKDVIRDYFSCREHHRALVVLNICAPVKEQLTACLNEVFVKRCEMANAKSKGKRTEFRDGRQDKKMERIQTNAEKLNERASKFQD